MITYDIFLLLNSNNSFSIQVIDCFKKAFVEKNIKRFISTTEYYSDLFLRDLDLNGIQLIVKKDMHNTLWDHMEWLTFNSQSDYISFIHDDDLFEDSFFLNTYKNLKKYLPVAYSNRAQKINNSSQKFKKRQFIPKNKVVSIPSNNVLNRFFLPLDTPIVLPTIAFNRKILEDYWKIYNFRNMSIFEDARIIYFFSRKGLFIENQNSLLYSYRINKNQISQTRKERDRLRLISWLANLKISFLYKLFLLLFAKIQFYIFYKESYFSSRFITKLFIIFRRKLIKRRIGE